jgi:hypothetical protein
MRHRNQRLTLWLSCCLLASPGGVLAQVGFPIELMQPAKTSPAPREAPSPEEPGAVTVPAGTHLLMKLTSALHTTSATRGAGVYLETSFPVVADDRVVIPEHTRVLGIVENGRRPGRAKGRAQMRFRFNTLILPDNHALAIVAGLQSLPGSSSHRTVDEAGTLEPVDQIDADVYTVTKTTGAGILIGSVSHIGIGVGPGALMGAGLGLARVLFTRGNEISLPVGTQVEMILQRPLTVTPRPSARDAM